jgi:zinc-binding alcohol dehydrogenase/oxidoreductase
MRAWYLTETPGSYEFGEIPTPEPGPGEIRVELKASGLNHLDLWVAKGMPAPHEFPHVSGGDGAGIVDALGEGVANPSIGDEVVIHPTVSFTGGGDAQILGEHAQGTMAEYVVIPAANALPKPSNLSWEEAGSFALATGTAWRMLRRARLHDGAKVLVVGVGGGVSSAALGIAVAMGAEVWVTSRDPQKIAWAKELGAVDGFDSTSEFARSVKGATDGGVDIVVENVGAATWNQSMRSMVTGGRLVTCAPRIGRAVRQGGDRPLRTQGGATPILPRRSVLLHVVVVASHSEDDARGRGEAGVHAGLSSRRSRVRVPSSPPMRSPWGLVALVR